MRRLRSTARPTVSAALWVGYALDGESDAMIEKKFEELAKLEAKMQQQQTANTSESSNQAHMDTTSPDINRTEGYLPESALEELFAATSVVPLEVLRRAGTARYAEDIDEYDDMRFWNCHREEEDMDIGSEAGSEGDDDGEAALAPEEEEEAEAAEALDEVPMPPRKRARGQARPRAVVREDDDEPDDDGDPTDAAGPEGIGFKAHLTPYRRVQAWTQYLHSIGIPSPPVTPEFVQEIGCARIDLLPSRFTTTGQPLYMWRPRWHYLHRDPAPRCLHSIARPDCAAFVPRTPAQLARFPLPPPPPPSTGPLHELNRRYSPFSKAPLSIAEDPLLLDIQAHTKMTKATLEGAGPSGIPFTVWRKLPNVFLDFVAVLLTPPSTVNLPAFIEDFSWATFVPHGFVFVWCPAAQDISGVVQAMYKVNLRHCDVLIQMHLDPIDSACPYFAIEDPKDPRPSHTNRLQTLLIAQTQHKAAPRLQLTHQRNPDVVFASGSPSAGSLTSTNIHRTIEVLIPFGRLCHLWGPSQPQRDRWTSFYPPPAHPTSSTGKRRR